MIPEHDIYCPFCGKGMYKNLRSKVIECRNCPYSIWIEFIGKDLFSHMEYSLLILNKNDYFRISAFDNKTTSFSDFNGFKFTCEYVELDLTKSLKEQCINIFEKYYKLKDFQ